MKSQKLNSPNFIIGINITKKSKGGRNQDFCFCLSLSCSVVSNSFGTPRTVAHQTSLFMGFPGQEYWSRLPFPSPGDLLDPGVEPISPTLAGDSLSPRKPRNRHYFGFLNLHLWANASFRT